MKISIRQISKQDAPSIMILCQQLGYDLSEKQIFENIQIILNNKDNDAFVAVFENKVIGWIGVSQAIQIRPFKSNQLLFVKYVD
jgi:hypothetical protein